MIATTQAPTHTREAKTSPREPKQMRLRIELLRRDAGVCARTGLDQKTVESYAELMADGAQFPALTVFDDGEKLWLADGFIRAEAALAAGLETFACEA